MIIGIGNDIIETNRIIKACKKDYFIRKIYTKKEQSLIEMDIYKAASNFAVKEAVVKMLGTGFRQIKPLDIEILRDELGKPYINLYDEALIEADRQNINKIHVSISDTKDLVSVFVIGESI